MNKTKHIIIPIFIPHEGCPFDCIFCNQKRISGQIEKVTTEDIRQKIIEYTNGDNVNNNRYLEVGFYGGSFTGIEQEKQIMYLKAAHEFIQTGFISAIRISTRPDFISEEILEYLTKYRVETIELGVQSMDDEVLRKSGRGHSSEDVYKAADLIKSYGIKLGIQTMVGLPGDTKEKAILSAQKIISISPSMVRIYPVLVVRETKLEEMYKKGIYTPLALNEAAEICKELLKLYNARNINVIRIGLQPTDEINNNSRQIEGPFHPAFRELVESELAFDTISELIIKAGFNKNEELTIKVPEHLVSIVTGQKRINIERLKNKFNYKEIKIITISDKFDIKYP